jgi:hypothetical protein
MKAYLSFAAALIGIVTLFAFGVIIRNRFHWLLGVVGILVLLGYRSGMGETGRRTKWFIILAIIAIPIISISFSNL